MEAIPDTKSLLELTTQMDSRRLPISKTPCRSESISASLSTILLRPYRLSSTLLFGSSTRAPGFSIASTRSSPTSGWRKPMSPTKQPKMVVKASSASRPSFAAGLERPHCQVCKYLYHPHQPAFHGRSLSNDVDVASYQRWSPSLSTCLHPYRKQGVHRHRKLHRIIRLPVFE